MGAILYLLKYRFIDGMSSENKSIKHTRTSLKEEL